MELEALEARTVPSGMPAPGATLDQALMLGVLQSNGASLQTQGSIINGASGAGSVDWYSFTLNQAAQVTLSTNDKAGGSSLNSVLTLYDNDTDTSINFGGHRLLAQDDGATHGGDALIERNLAPGMYFVAVSGSRNQYFNPFLADSGFAGSTGNYNLAIQEGTAISGPVATVDATPVAIWMSLSAALDPTLLQVDPSQGQNVFLRDSTGSDVPLSYVNYSQNAQELQLFPQAPLRAGTYSLSIGPLNFSTTFSIGPAKGTSSSDDTLATAHDLGNVTNAGVVIGTGTIGNDPFDQLFNGYSNAPATFSPNYAGNDVDLYHFRITGSGRFSLAVEVFGGRINSTLDPAITIFNSSGQILAVADNSTNNAQATDGSQPLFNDPLLYLGLTAGDYYLGVSSHGNLADLVQGVPGYDPTISQSGSGGLSTGRYVLSLGVFGDNVRPAVTASSLVEGSVLNGPPTGFTVQFSKEVNLEQLGYQLAQIQGQSFNNAVYFTDAMGINRYHAQLIGYDHTTHLATFRMLDALPAGAATLHLSGAAGLTDLAGNPLIGDDPSGDYVIHLTVGGPSRGSPGNIQKWYDQEPNNTFGTAQFIGPLFPTELAGNAYRVHFIRLANAGATDTADYYQFQVLQTGTYAFAFMSTAPGITPTRTLTDSNGNPIVLRGTLTKQADLTAGVTYVLRLGWSLAQAPLVRYDLRLGLSVLNESPTVLTTGPAPALRIRLGPYVPPTPTITFPNGASDLAPGLGFTTNSFTMFGIPGGLLIQLASSSVGGVSAPTSDTSASSNVLVLDLRDSASQGIQPAAATGSQSGGEATGVNLADLLRVVQDCLRGLEAGWIPSLDLLFRSNGEGTPRPSARPNTQETEEQGQSEENEASQRMDPPHTNSADSSWEIEEIPALDRAWVSGLAFASALPLLLPPAYSLNSRDERKSRQGATPARSRLAS
jgi:hypothetical protein